MGGNDQNAQYIPLLVGIDRYLGADEGEADEHDQRQGQVIHLQYHSLVKIRPE